MGLKAGTGGQREFCKVVGKGPNAVCYHNLIDFHVKPLFHPHQGMGCRDWSSDNSEIYTIISDGFVT